MIRWTGLAPWEFEFPFPLRQLLAEQLAFVLPVLKASREGSKELRDLKDLTIHDLSQVLAEQLAFVLQVLPTGPNPLYHRDD